MKKNDIIDLEIYDMTNLGVGVAKSDDGAVVFVSGAVEGDLVRAKIIKVASSYLVARTEEILRPSVYRVESGCPVSSRCGGCAFRSISYDREKELKKRSVEAFFKKAGIEDAKIAAICKIPHLRP